MTRRGGLQSDHSVCGQRVRAEHAHGLPAAPLHCPPCGHSAAAMALCPGGPFGRDLRRGGVSAGVGLSESAAGEDRGRGGPLGARLRRRGADSPADAAAVRRVLRHGRVCAGPGAAGGQRRAGGPGGVLYRRLRQGAADCRRRGLWGDDGGVPGGGPPRPGRRAGGDPGVRAGPDRPGDGPAGYRQRPAGLRDRSGGAGGVSGGIGRRSAAVGTANADTGAAAVPAGPAGAVGAGGAGAAVASAALPGGGGAGGTAAGDAQRLDRD